MTAPRRPQIGHHYLDSGPLFCLGGSSVLADLFDAHLLAKSRVAAAVVREVDRNATLILPPVGPHPKRKVKQSARIVRGRYKALLAAAAPTPAPVPQLLASIKTDLTISAAKKLNAGQASHPNAHDGESESLYWAATQSVELVTNDGDAYRIARKYRVPSSTLVEVARHLVKAQKVVGRRAVFNELMTLSKHQIFPGEHITNELDLV